MLLILWCNIVFYPQGNKLNHRLKPKLMEAVYI